LQEVVRIYILYYLFCHVANIKNERTPAGLFPSGVLMIYGFCRFLGLVEARRFELLSNRGQPERRYEHSL